jgi:hypothetical protein
VKEPTVCDQSVLKLLSQTSICTLNSSFQKQGHPKTPKSNQKLHSRLMKFTCFVPPTTWITQ